MFDKGIVSHQRVFEKSLFTSIDQFKLEVKQYSTRYDFDIDLFFKCGHAKHNLDEPLSKSSSAYSLQFHQDLSLQTCFELVTETDVFNSLFITEKTFKPILNKSPFLISGSPYTLAYLRKLGFETFDKLFDESYDSEIVYYDRVSILMDNMKRATKFNLLECYKNTTR